MAVPPDPLLAEDANNNNFEGLTFSKSSMVKLYATPVCPYCFTLKEFLKENNIEFEEIDVSQDEKAKEELIKKSGKMEVPVIEINGEIVAGFDKEKICKLLKIKE